MSKVICPNCGSPSASARAPRVYHYEESGLPNLWLRGGVTEVVCPDCGEESAKIEKEGQLLQVITMALLMSPRPMTGPEMRFVRGACQMTQAEFAESLNLPRRETIADRESKQDPGLSFAEELGLRGVLIRTFLEHLKTGDNGLLRQDQMSELTRFAQHFYEFSKFAEKRLGKLQVALEKHDWRLKKAA